MKTTKLNLLLLLLTLGVFAFSSCEDEFTEEDFLEMQAELAESQRAFDLEKLILEYNLTRENDSAAMVFSQQLQAYYEELESEQDAENLEALRQAGFLSSLTVTIEDQRGVAIPNATVSVGGSNAAGRFDVTSDATGQAIVNDIVIGASPVQVTATGFVGVSFILDLGNLPSNGTDYLFIGDEVFPLGRHETSRITLLSSDGANGTFATVTGTATIETDLRNATPEIPQGATVVAYVDGASGSSTYYQSSVSMYDFRFIGESIGSATIDNTTGAWSMQLPANEAGITYNMVYSEILADQVVAIQGRNGVAVTPEYATIPTRFGPSANNTGYDGIPSVPGAMVVFETPPAAGTGFGLTFTQVARPLFTSTADVTFNGVIEGSPDGNNTIFRLNNRGSGYSTSPSVVVDGGNGTGTDATIIASINGRITGLSASTLGTGYVDGDVLSVTVEPRNAGGAAIMPDNDPSTFGVQSSFTFNVTVSGVSGTGALPASLTLPTGSNIGVNTDVQMGFGVASYNVTFTGGSGTGAVLSVSSASATVDAIRFSNGGSEYTGPATITISGGNGLGGTPTQASMSMGAMAFEYIIAANNTSASGYQVMPTLQYEYTSNTGSVLKTGDITAYESDNSTINGTPTLNGSMQLSSGTIVFKNTGLSHRTLFTRTAPAAEIVSVASVAPTASVGINSTTGALTFVSVNTAGSGYATQFGASIVPTIAGAPGSGASISIPGFSFNFNSTTGEVTYNFSGVNFIGGSGYLPNLNRPSFTSFNAPSSISAVSGKTVLVEVVYGTGARTQVVN